MDKCEKFSKRIHIQDDFVGQQVENTSNEYSSIKDEEENGKNNTSSSSSNKDNFPTSTWVDELKSISASFFKINKTLENFCFGFCPIKALATFILFEKDRKVLENTILQANHQLLLYF